MGYTVHSLHNVQRLQIMHKNVNVAEARKNFSDLLNEAHYTKERIQIVKNNKPVAYIVPVEDVETLEKIEDALDLQDALNAKNEDGFTDWEEIKQCIK